MGTTFAPSGTVRTRAATRGGRVASVSARAAQNRACRVPTLAAARRYPRTGAGITDLARVHAVSPAHQRVGVPPARSSRGKINRGTTVISRDAVSEAPVGEEATEAPVEAETPPKQNNVVVHRVLDRAEDAVLGLFTSVGRDASGGGDEGDEKVPQELDRQTKAVNEGMPIVFVTAEVSPWSKTGGLGDVCGALPAALAARGNRVVVVAPMYERYDDARDTGHHSTFHLNHGDQHVRYFARYKDDVTYLFVAHPALERGGGGRIYGGSPGNPYHDNDFRFALLSMAAIESLLAVPWEDLFFGGGDAGTERMKRAYFETAPVFVANDWHASLVPLFLAARYQANAEWTLKPRREWGTDGAAAAIARASCVTIVHNLFHLGIVAPDRYRSLGLPEENTEWFPALRWRWRDGGESMNFLKAGLATSSAAVLVSPSYANEVQTNELGCGMDKVLRSVGNFGSDVDLGFLNGMSGKLRGIVNGIDVDEWNPATDPHIPAHFDVGTSEKGVVERADGSTVWDVARGKAACKAALQRELGLEVDPKAPLVGFIGRLDYQKGVDVLLDVVPHIVHNGGQVVMLGSGDPGLEHGMRTMEQNHRGRAVGWVGFSVPMSHKITAAADILAMPSRFEPCGLNQLYALRYGTLPVAHATGGLRDTVRGRVGWPFAPCEPGALRRAMDRAMETYKASEGNTRLDSRWRRKQERAMTSDLSWNVAAEKYEKLMGKIALDPPPALRRPAPELLEAAASAAVAEEEEGQWRAAEKRAERLRRRAAKAPCDDTRRRDNDLPAWMSMLPKFLQHPLM